MENHNSPPIETIIDNHAPYTFNLSLKLTVDSDKAEDLAQDTFIKAWIHIVDLKNETAIKSWLRTICINEFRMMIRKEKREATAYIESVEKLERDGTLLAGYPPLIMDEVRISEEVANLRSGCFLIMTRRPTLNQRMVFSLIDMFGLPIGEVPQFLDLTPRAVKGLLHRARMNLESFFQGHCGFADISNPCRCTAWMELMRDRNIFQEKLRQKKEYLDYKEKGYVHDPDTSQKILYYYRNMPEQRPFQEWFEGLTTLMEDCYKGCK